MNLAHIDEFITLVEVGNYQRAADELFITQSVLSKHIMALEKDLGYDLLLRKYRKLELTDEGRRFLIHAKKLSDEYRKIMIDAPIQTTPKSKQIILACSSNKKLIQLAHLASRFQREFPDCGLNIIQIETVEVDNMLKNGSADIAVVTAGLDLISLPGFRTERLSLCSHMVAYLPNHHRLASRTSIQLDELVEENFVSLPPEAYSSIARKQLTEQNGLDLNIIYSVRRRETAINFVKNGLVVFLGLKDTDAGEDETPGVTTVALEPRVDLYMQIIYPDNPLPVEEKWVVERLRIL